MRTRAVAFVDGRMNVVSDRLNCRASACIVASSSARPSSNTQSGLPVSGPRSRVKTLTMRKRKSAMSVRRVAELRHAREDLLVHAAEAAVGHDEHVVAGLQHAPEGFYHRAHVDVREGARAERRERVRRIPAEVLG